MSTHAATQPRFLALDALRGVLALFVVLFQARRTLRSIRQMLLAGCLYGVLLWIVNFFVLAPIFGWYWFPDRTNPAIQFLAHTFFYGCPLSYYLWREAVMTPAAD